MGKIDKLNTIAREVCNTYNVTYCFDKAYCCRRYKHLPFQREYNDNVTISSYVKGNYDFYDVEQIEEFIAFKGAFELATVPCVFSEKSCCSNALPKGLLSLEYTNVANEDCVKFCTKEKIQV